MRLIFDLNYYDCLSLTDNVLINLPISHNPSSSKDAKGPHFFDKSELVGLEILGNLSTVFGALKIMPFLRELLLLCSL